MSIFKSIRKGFKKVFKKIGGAIKKQFKRIGKFINKAGILGQLAMMFILPGVGGALMKGISGAFGKLVGSAATKVGTKVATDVAVKAGTDVAVKAGTDAAVKAGASKAAEVATTKVVEGSGMLGSKSAAIRGAGKVLEAAGNFVKVGAKAFSTVTEGISSFIGEFSKTALNKIPGVNIGSAAPSAGQAWKNVQNSVMKNASGTVEAFNTSIGIKPVEGATKFGTEGFKVADRVSVDSLKSSKLADTSAGIVDGPALLKQTEGIDLAKTTANLDLDKTLPAPTDSTLGGFAGEPTTGVKFYETNSNSLLADPKVTTPTPESTYERLQRQNIPTPTSADKVFKQTGTDIATPGSDPSLANLNFGEQIVQNVSALPGKIKQSILDFPTNLAKVPEQFADNLTDTITKLPSTALTAALNKPDAAQVTYSSVGLSDIPQSTYGMNQSNIAESGIAVAGYQSKVNPTALYGNQNQAYDQFFKMMGPQAQQMRA
jgi:hypothetical protein